MKMPLTPFQKIVFGILKANRNPDSYVAGGTMIHREDDSQRFSRDIDIFHDTDLAVAEAYSKDCTLLKQESMMIDILIERPNFYRVLVKKGKETLLLEWARDTAFRFFPVMQDDEVGQRLHPVDLAVNKCLAFASRSEARDFLDMLYIHDHTLSLAGCVWAACGKDPGFTPDLLLEMIQRHSALSPDQIERESVREKIDPVALKKKFLKILNECKRVIDSFDPKDLGCLFLDGGGRVIPKPDKAAVKSALKHFGSVRGALPQIVANI